MAEEKKGKKSKKKDFIFKMITIGDQSTGKTCCINRYTDG